MQAGTIRPFKEAWKNELQKLKSEYFTIRYPLFASVSAEMRGKWDDTTANGLTTCIIDYLNYRGGNFTRINVMGVPRKGKDGRTIMTPSTTKKGTADIVGCYQGRYIAVEVKIGADRQSKEQIQEQKDVERAGGIYMIAKDFPTFRADFENMMQ